MEMTAPVGSARAEVHAEATQLVERMEFLRREFEKAGATDLVLSRQRERVCELEIERKALGAKAREFARQIGAHDPETVRIEACEALLEEALRRAQGIIELRTKKEEE
jgi:hypothetical protein